MMNAAAHQIPSPVSPYTQQHRPSFSAPHQRYPMSPAMSPPRQQAPPRGLGLYPVPMGPSHSASVSPMVASPQPEDWSQAPAMEAQYSASQHSDMLSAAFDPFSGFSSTGMVGAQSPEAPGLEFCHSPPSSNLQSHRGSVSSYAPSDGSDRAYTPRARHDDARDWYASAAGDDILTRTSTQAAVSYAPSSNTLPSQTEDLYRPQPTQAEDLYRPHAEWSKEDTVTYMSQFQAGPEGRIPRFEINNTMLPSAARIKKKRRRTTPEEATHDCKVCGKLFKRSYNWKSHLETHNPERKYPHPCLAMIGDVPCTKKFQRKTDLDRHHDSVHLKARNHECKLCGHRFARRDTLRRHTEDGCPKRFELGVHDSAAAVASQQQSSRWSFPSSAAAAAAAAAAASAYPRSRSFSGAIPQSSPIAWQPGSAAGPGTYPMYPPATLPPQSAFHA
ncbi:MAG: hypothetical protein LQ340_003636 [Diploschistes diacapsis]|nr:MAG: hypothetical protein LQ340_003636 [Diploschistes diacapsis]